MNLYVFFAGLYFGGIVALLGQMVATDPASGPFGVRGLQHFFLSFLSAITWPLSLIAAYIVTANQRKQDEHMRSQFDARPVALPAIAPVLRDDAGLDLELVRQACLSVALLGDKLEVVARQLDVIDARLEGLETVDCDCDETCGDDCGCQDFCGCRKNLTGDWLVKSNGEQ